MPLEWGEHVVPLYSWILDITVEETSTFSWVNAYHFHQNVTWTLLIGQMAPWMWLMLPAFTMNVYFWLYTFLLMWIMYRTTLQIKCCSSQDFSTECFMKYIQIYLSGTKNVAKRVRYVRPVFCVISFYLYILGDIHAVSRWFVQILSFYWALWLFTNIFHGCFTGTRVSLGDIVKSAKIKKPNRAYMALLINMPRKWLIYPGVPMTSVS